jgi:hypothetical protein
MVHTESIIKGMVLSLKLARGRLAAEATKDKRGCHSIREKSISEIQL